MAELSQRGARALVEVGEDHGGRGTVLVIRGVMGVYWCRSVPSRDPLWLPGSGLFVLGGVWGSKVVSKNRRRA